MKTKITLVLALFFSLYSFGQVGTIFTSGLIKYKITATATVEVGQNYPISGVVIIPATVTYNSATYQVTSIGDYAFYGCSGLTSVTIPTSVTSIGATAFYVCSGLTSVTIPNSVTSIGENAFYECTGLTSVTIPNSVTFIGITAFYGCTGLTSVTIPTSVTRIEDAVFSGCTGLTSVSIPNSVTFIGNSAFNGCTGLTSVTIPNSVTSIDQFAFQGCTGLASVSIPNSVTSISAFAFEGCTGLTSVTIPNSVTSIGLYAFQHCSGLTSVTIPNSLTFIDEFAFEDCTGLTSVTIPNSVTSIHSGAFAGCSGLTSVTVNWTTPLPIDSYVFDKLTLSAVALNVPAGTVAAYDAAAVWMDFNPIIDNVTAAPVLNQTFAVNGINYIVTKSTAPFEVAVGSNISFVGAATIPSSVTNAGNSFTVTSIGDNAFPSCITLTSVIIPNSVTNIARNAFYNCTSLTAVTIPNSVTSIGDEAFYRCSGLTTISIPSSVTNIGIAAFGYCSGLTSISIPNSITSINRELFFACNALTSIILPNSVTSIGTNAFAACFGLTSVTIPNSVTSIGANAFNSCTSLTSIIIPNSITSISNGLFYNCTSLSSIVIPNSVTSIGSEAFDYCIGLTSITIGNAVTSIGDYAFSSCRALTSVTVNLTTPLTINANVFNAVSLSTKTLKVPVGSEIAYDAKPVWTDFGAITDVNVVPVLNQTFVANGINYIVTKVNLPYEVAVDSNTDFVGAATIPATVSNTGDSFAVTRIGQAAFSGCIGLMSVSIPNSVTSIGEGAFSGCTSLTSLSIPNSVTSIENSTFGGCSGLTSVTIGNAVTSIGRAAFGNCTSLTSIVIPNSVTSIGEHTFVGCTGLTSFNIPNSVTSIGAFAFQDCIGLTSVTVNRTTPPTINSAVFQGLNLSNIILNVPIGTEIAYNSSLGWTSFPSITDVVNYCKGKTAQPLTALFTPESTLKWYTVATGGRASTTAPKPTTTIVGTKLFYVSLVVNGLESARETITVNTIALPATPGAMTTSDTLLCKYIGTTNEVTYTVPAVAGTTYSWSTPAGVNVIADTSATDNSITVNFAGSALNNTSVGGIGTIAVRAVNDFGCISSAPRSLVLTAKLPTSPTSLTLTSADTNANFNSGIPAVPTSLSDLEKITKVGAYMGTDIVFTLTAPLAPTAASYAWTLPAGVNQLTGDTSNEITVNFAGVAPGIGLLPISVKSVGGCGESTLARTLNLSRALPTAPTALVLTDDAISSTPITKVSAYTGKLTPLTLTATPARLQGATATSYAWILPDGVNCSSCTVPNTIITVQQSVNTGTFTLEGAPIFEIRDFDAIKTATSTITINFADVAPETLSFPLTVFAVNGTGNSKARIRTVTAAAPTSPAITAVGGTTFNNCNSKTYSVLQTLGTSYTWTVPAGATYVQTGNQIVVDYNGVEATVGTTAQVTCVASNGTGSSAAKILNVKRVACLVRLANGSSANDFKVSAYPNPSSSEFTIETSAKGAMNLKVYDIQGRLVENTHSTQIGSKLAVGIYNVIVNQGTNTKTLRVIKK